MLRALIVSAAVAVPAVAGVALTRQTSEPPRPAAAPVTSTAAVAPAPRTATAPATAPAPRDPLPRLRRPPRPPFEPVRWRRSRSLGLHWSGRLVGGVQLPPAAETYFTWDPVLRRSPNRGWRRVGSDRLVRVVLRVLTEFSRAHPDAPRIGVGDLSRPRGGDFGVRFGRPGHVSHQNGLDADVYYPRLDRAERPPRTVQQIDRRLAQDLVDRFVRAGAIRVFVGPGTGLVGPPGVVQPLVRHDDHLHVRLG